MAVVKTADSEGPWLPLTTPRLRQQQEADGTLALVRDWLELEQRPEWTEVSSQGPEVKAYHSQWGNLEVHDWLLYRRWHAPIQQLVPRLLRPQIVHGLAGAGHYRNFKTLRRLRWQFYWPGCRRDMELHVHCCKSCTAKKRLYDTRCRGGPSNQGTRYGCIVLSAKRESPQSFRATGRGLVKL